MHHFSGRSSGGSATDSVVRADNVYPGPTYTARKVVLVLPAKVTIRFYNRPDDLRRGEVGEVEQFTFYVNDERSSIQWLRQLLSEEPLSYQQIQPLFLQELQQNRVEQTPELQKLLQQNFLQDAQGCWYLPDPTSQIDLERLRHRELLREFESYQEGRGRLKSVRSEAVRVGFEQAYRASDYTTILQVAARLPDAVLREDSQILTYYDLASMEMEG